MTTTPTIPRPRTPSESLDDSPPRAASVLAVTARPGQESADLGGLLYAFRRAGASLSLLSLTRGEAAGQNSGSARLEAVRPGRRSWPPPSSASAASRSRTTATARCPGTRPPSWPTGSVARSASVPPTWSLSSPRRPATAPTPPWPAPRRKPPQRPGCQRSRTRVRAGPAPGRLTWAPTRRPPGPSRSPPPPRTPVSPTHCLRSSAGWTCSGAARRSAGSSSRSDIRSPAR